MVMLNSKKLTIGVLIFIIVAVLAGGVYLYFSHGNLSKDPLLKSVFSVVPAFSAKVKESEQINELERQKKLIDDEKSKIQAEWAKIEKANKELQTKQQELDAREQAINAKEAQLAASQDKVQSALTNIKNIAQYYESMDPSSAAKIFAAMDENLVIQILSNMNQKDAISQILSNLDPKKAASITKKMSGL